MLVFSKIQSVRNHLAAIKSTNSIGFVPTMGALHQGHLSLLKKALFENDITVASIFVNPTQFDKEEDLVNYPKPLENDLKLLKNIGCDVVFTPTPEEIYSSEIVSDSFDFGGLETIMEGRFRQGHFDGVGTIVKKLLEIIRPSKAYFGEKDFQQLLIIKQLVKQNNIPVDIISCPIFRESDGLAMSSRNMRLTKKQRIEAPKIYKTLLEAEKWLKSSPVSRVKDRVKITIENSTELKLEYFELVDENTLQEVSELTKGVTYRAFIAVYAGTIRLIDNIPITA
jgi:pantoate--beta-alanine ligase